MRLGVVTESSTAERNSVVVECLKGRGHEIINLGMSSPEDTPSMNYMHTSFMAAALLNLNIVDFIVGGCGTGQGFGIAVNKYPGVFCGHIVSPLDAWLFSQINAGNAISLMLNQGYGWAGEIQLRFIFDRLFEKEMGLGFPEYRKEIQRTAREVLQEASGAIARSFGDIVKGLDKSIVRHCLANEVFYGLISSAEGETAEIILETGR